VIRHSPAGSWRGTTGALVLDPVFRSTATFGRKAAKEVEYAICVGQPLAMAMDADVVKLEVLVYPDGGTQVSVPPMDELRRVPVLESAAVAIRRAADSAARDLELLACSQCGEPVPASEPLRTATQRCSPAVTRPISRPRCRSMVVRSRLDAGARSSRETHRSGSTGCPLTPHHRRRRFRSGRPASIAVMTPATVRRFWSLAVADTTIHR
jgi:hypothetical protein